MSFNACSFKQEYKKKPLLRITATQSVPTFVQEILGERVHEEETVVFDALYSGNPVPGENDSDRYTMFIAVYSNTVYSVCKWVSIQIW